VSVRLVAGGALPIAGSFVLAGWTALVVVLAYGFVARVLAGPRLSPRGTRAGRRAPSCDQLVAGPTRSAGPGSLWGPQQAAP
jgi:hypothetical protein